jgi:hypothetical protein
LCIVQDEGHELDQRLFLLVPSRVRLAYRGRARARRSAYEQREKILFENQAQHQQDQCAANAQMHPSKLESSASTALIAAIFKHPG